MSVVLRFFTNTNIFNLKFRHKQVAVEFRRIIILAPKKEINVHAYQERIKGPFILSCAYITTLRVLFHCSFPTQLKNRQIDKVKACSFLTFFLFRSSCSSRISVLEMFLKYILRLL